MSPVAIALAAAALSGASTLVIELSAVRVVAPWFGASTLVWTNVIGVVLLALSLGYLAGSRWADRASPERALARLLALAGLASALLPFGARPICELFAPRGVALAESVALFGWGSLAATLSLFLPPAFLLGAVQPLCVELVQRARGGHAGRAGGQVLAASTLASLAGTFATAHVLLPSLGIARTFGLAAALLFAGAALVAASRRSAVAAAVLALCAPAAFAAPRFELPPLPRGLRALAERQSSYQLLRAVEDTRGAETLRLLLVDEGLDSFQSVWAPRAGLIGEGYYYDAFALPAWWSRASGRWRAAVLGLGCGTAFRVLEGASPPDLALEAWGVELDPAVVELGEAWFELPRGDGARAVSSGYDARTALRARPDPFDLVILDAYAHQTEIPAHLSSLEFFREVRDRLAPRGWLAINVGAFGCDDPVVTAIAGTVARAFDRAVLALAVPAARNVVLFARRDAQPPRPGEEAWRIQGEGELAARIARMLGPPSLHGRWSWIEPSQGSVLTDDRNPIEALQRRSLEEARERMLGAR